MRTLDELKKDLKFAKEGLEQMQQIDAGYFEDFKNKQQFEIDKFEYDIKGQTDGIAKLEKLIAKREV